MADVILEFDAEGNTVRQHHVPIPTASKASWQEFLDKKVPARRRTVTHCYAKRLQSQQSADREEARNRKMFEAAGIKFPEVVKVYHESVVAFYRYIGYDDELKKIMGN